MRAQGIHNQGDLRLFLLNHRQDIGAWARNRGFNPDEVRAGLDTIPGQGGYLQDFFQEWILNYFGNWLTHIWIAF